MIYEVRQVREHEKIQLRMEEERQKMGNNYKDRKRILWQGLGSAVTELPIAETVMQSFSQLHLGYIFQQEWGSWEGGNLCISASGRKTSL